MRAGPLSNNDVISILNRYFVPVYTSNEVSGPSGKGAPEERAALQRIVGSFERARLGTGDVRVYILSPDAQPLASLDLGKALDTGQLLAALTGVVRKLGTQPGAPLVAPHPQSSPPAAEPGALVLHLTARGFNQGSWREFPGENWISLAPAEWKKLLPPAGTQTWVIDPVLSRKLLSNFYPQTEDTSSADRNRIERQSLKAAVISAKGGIVLARLDGSLRMLRSFYPGRDDYKPVEATLTGFIDFDPATGQIQTLALVTEKATYGSESFGAGMHTVTADTRSRAAR